MSSASIATLVPGVTGRVCCAATHVNEPPVLAEEGCKAARGVGREESERCRAALMAYADYCRGMAAGCTRRLHERARMHGLLKRKKPWKLPDIWNECIEQYGGPYLFGKQRCMADAMYAPVATRFQTYHVKLDRTSLLYCSQIMAMPEMKEWRAAAQLEPDEIDELDMDF